MPIPVAALLAAVAVAEGAKQVGGYFARKKAKKQAKEEAKENKRETKGNLLQERKKQHATK